MIARQLLFVRVFCLGLAVVLVAVQAASSTASFRPGAALSPIADWFYEGALLGDELGSSVASAGDVNGDGYSDVIVGAPHATHQVSKEGVAYVFYGSSSGLSTDPDWTAGSGQQGALFGASVSTAGDVNDDGYDDVIVGAYEYNDQIEVRVGAAFVYLGSENGLSTAAHRILLGAHKDSNFGISVGTAGDVNDDGYDDVIVGARWHTDGETNEGAAFVFLGSDAGLGTVADWSVMSNQAGAGFGTSVGTAGDINHDGYDDIVIGAPFYDSSFSDEGAVFVFYGADGNLDTDSPWIAYGGQEEAHFGISVSTAGDVNRDGYADIVVGAPSYDGEIADEGAAFAYYGSDEGLNAGHDWKVSSGQEASGFGISVATAASMNGDSYADVVVGAYRYEHDPSHEDFQSLEGFAFVYCGSPSGLHTQAGWTAEGNKAETEFGYAVGAAGNVNGDAYADVIVGAPRYRRERDPLGRAFVYYGAPMIFRSYLPLVAR